MPWTTADRAENRTEIVRCVSLLTTPEKTIEAAVKILSTCLVTLPEKATDAPTIFLAALLLMTPDKALPTAASGTIIFLTVLPLNTADTADNSIAARRIKVAFKAETWADKINPTFFAAIPFIAINVATRWCRVFLLTAPLTVADAAANKYAVRLVKVPFKAAAVATRLFVNITIAEIRADNAAAVALKTITDFLTMEPFKADAAETKEYNVFFTRNPFKLAAIAISAARTFLTKDPFNAENTASTGIWLCLVATPETGAATAGKELT